MITSGLIQLANFVISSILTIFPESSGFPAEVSTAFVYIGGYVGMLDPLVPVATLGTVVGILIGVELLIFAFRAITWMFSKLPIIGK